MVWGIYMSNIWRMNTKRWAFVNKMVLNLFQKWQCSSIFINIYVGGLPKPRFTVGIWMFPKIGVPQNGWFIMETRLKWMIWGYHDFRKHPYILFTFLIHFSYSPSEWWNPWSLVWVSTNQNVPSDCAASPWSAEVPSCRSHLSLGFPGNLMSSLQMEVLGS